MESELIPIARRWIYMQSFAGRLVNAGIRDPKTIELALWKFLKTRCEDGVNFDPKKVIALAQYAARPRPSDIVFFEPSPEVAQNMEMQLWNIRVLAERTTC
jgi:hypothetical protein